MLEVAVMAAVGIALAGCSTAGGLSGEGEAGRGMHSGETVSLPDARPGITGIITEIERVPGGEAPSFERVLVEENPGQGKAEGYSGSQAEEGRNKLYLDITGETSIFRRTSGDEENLARATSADLERGQRVRAWHEDVVAKSYPGQTDARVIMIDDTNATLDRTADTGP